MEKYIAGFGEIMLRLSPASHYRFEQTLPGQLDAVFGGGEANVCASIAMLGGKARYLTALPDNRIASACVRQLRGLGVDTSFIKLSNTGRMGIYFAETGAAMRGGEVIYDRAGSTVSLLGPEEYDFAAMLKDCGRLHLTGITPALSEKAFESTLAVAEYAAEHGIKVSVDLNFRKKLWQWSQDKLPGALAEECLERIVRSADVIIGNEADAEDVFGIKSAGSCADSGKINPAGYIETAKRLADRFPMARYIAITLRQSVSADHNNWGAMLYDRGNDTAHFAPLNEEWEYSPYEIRDITDRIGGADSFCAGLLFALESPALAEPSTAIRFAPAASALKHTVHGDYNFISAEEVTTLMNGSASGRVKR